MLDEIIHNQDLQQFFKTYQQGDTLFLEGEESRDLYVLVSGRLDVLKGGKKIAEITEPGALFGELSFLLSVKRTATIRAENEAGVLRIPQKEVHAFLKKFPAAGEKITEIIARRLDESSQAVYGLRQICDKFPDAVLVTDGAGRILAWNAAAEKLYGRDWHRMHETSTEDIYEQPQAYRQLLEETLSKSSVREKVLKIRHPEKGPRFISTSTTLLSEDLSETQSVLWLARDVTATQRMENQYRKTRYWLVPSVILVVCLVAAVIFGYPYFSKGVRTTDQRKLAVRNLLAKDYLLLKSLLTEPLSRGDRAQTSQVLKEFFSLQATQDCPYHGLVLLDAKKKVVDAFSIKAGVDAQTLIGTSYSGIQFHGSDRSLFHVLILYRTDPEHPMGQKGIEIAFALKKDHQTMGWLLFQMDMPRLQTDYEVDEDELRRFQS